MTCPKCESDTGWKGPEFVPGARVPMAAGGFAQLEHDSLAFACKACGYKRYEPAKDAPLAIPDPPAPPDPRSNPNQRVREFGRSSDR